MIFLAANIRCLKKVPNSGLSKKSLALNSISSEDIQANDIDELDMAIEPAIKKSSVNIKTAPLQIVRIIHTVQE